MDLTHLLPLAPEGSVEKRAKRHDKTFKRMAYFFYVFGLICAFVIICLDENLWPTAITVITVSGFCIVLGTGLLFDQRANDRDRREQPFIHHIIEPFWLPIIDISTETIILQDMYGKTAQFPRELFQQLHPRVSNAVSQMTIIVSRTLEDPECDLLIPPTKPITK